MLNYVSKAILQLYFNTEIDHLNGIMFYDYIDANEPLKPHEEAVEV